MKKKVNINVEINVHSESEMEIPGKKTYTNTKKLLMKINEFE